MFESYQGRVDFYWIYVREAHPSDGLRPARHVSVAQPKSFDAREQVASTCAAHVELTVPVLVDDMEDSVAKAYNALPDRLFILSADGKIAYRGERGPRGFNVDEMEKALAGLVTDTPKAKKSLPKRRF